MTRIGKFEVLEKIKAAKGGIFGVSFVKKDKTLRKMVCRLGVQKDLKGTGKKYDPALKGLLGVFDMQKEEYRTINLETLRSLKVNGRHYRIGEARAYKKKAVAK